MSKILILISPAEGHFNPFVPIIKKLVQRKHDVVCMTGRTYEKRIANLGAIFKSIPEKWDPQDMEYYDFYPALKQKKGISQIKYYIKNILFDKIPDTLYSLRKLMDAFSPDLIIYDSFQLAGLYAAEMNGQRCALLSVLPLNIPGKNLAPFGLGLLPGKSLFTMLRNKLLNTVLEQLLFRDIRNYSNKIRNEIGLSTLRKDIFVFLFEKPNIVLHTSIPSFEYERAEFPPNFHFIGHVPAPFVQNYRKPDWWQQIEKDLPVVLINQGTLAKNLDDLVKPAIEALKDENVIVLAVPVKEDEIHNLPKNTYIEPFIPFGNILPFVDIMITNGGFGATQNALAHGIPIVIAGATEDKMEVAARLENTGAGINLGKHLPTPQKIKKAVNKIMSDPTYKMKAKELQKEYAKYDAPSLAVELIEELLIKTNKGHHMAIS